MRDHPPSGRELGVAEEILDEDEPAPRSEPRPSSERARSEQPPASQVIVVETDGGAQNDGASAAVPAMPAPAPVPEPVPRSVYQARLADRKVLKSIRKHVAHVYRLKWNEADDLVQSTYLRATKASGWPSDEGKMLAWLKSIAFRAHLDHCRAIRRQELREVLRANVDVVQERQGRHDGVTAQHAESAATKVASESPERATDFEIFKELRILKLPAKEIAARYRIGHWVVYKRSDRFTARVKGVLTDITVAAAAGFALLLLIGHLASSQPNVVASGPTAPGPEVALPAQATQITPRSMRVAALESCKAKQYGRCLDILDMAKRVDPDGDKDPAIQAARKDAEDALKRPVRAPDK